MEEILKKINIKKVGNVGLIVSIAIITYYGLSSYKTLLEIKKLKNAE